ncbi:50S ribosomal protein L25/general stress protein Ctc [Bosea sp. (in: a-proteobacteria)]|jgi:large subunit ribosomal protein L25|uniref:50S ribosomal protein L25/general stress protein Ctc n=1 Tax=Bosea sp. (in: a-proteobacteria) TaxID=1871050 RepID=UPI00086C3D29|nr:50S ribosomal protein L25/general stress protein Ctc [Bosea sp. (in: a-proteobacteria)]MBN9435515.1 50S ribosomal protein L25/general stress protein Ctc [Bosea sp. (in: a-proteobacteria)]MBN9446469.1 50S ribosomal protein L25/general stress protein Ctc [Bosea sp. (in: a-proteobacteria)]ODT53375.1 MAG: 50S ribosomal protein L25/general stress protein Ctc [Methylobacterium sp. SCN 67-24]
MTAVKQIQASARAQVGKGAARAVRRQGLTPAVIYGAGEAPQAIALNANQTRLMIYAGHFLTTLLEIDVDGKKTRVIPRDYQLDPVRDTPLHVDFLRVAAGQTIKVQVPVHVVGQEDSPGLKNGGTMQIVEHTVEIDVAPESIPDFLEVSVAGLEVGDTLHSNDIKLPAGVSLTSRDNLTLVTIVPPTVDAEAEAAAETEAAKA